MEPKVTWRSTDTIRVPIDRLSREPIVYTMQGTFRLLIAHGPGQASNLKSNSFAPASSRNTG